MLVSGHVDVSTHYRGEKKYDLHLEPKIHIGDGSVPGDREYEPDLDLINPRIPWSRLKVREAEYFLAQLEGSFRHEAKAMYNMDAFVMALRSITEVLRKDCKGRSGFEPWYSEVIEGLKADPDVSFFIDLRNRSLHQGAKPPVLALNLICCEDKDEEPSIRFEFSLHGAGGRALRDGQAACHRALARLRQVVDEAELREFLRPRKDAKQHVFAFAFRKERPDGTWQEVTAGDLKFTSQLEEIGLESSLRRIPPARKRP